MFFSVCVCVCVYVCVCVCVWVGGGGGGGAFQNYTPACINRPLPDDPNFLAPYTSSTTRLGMHVFLYKPLKGLVSMDNKR